MEITSSGSSRSSNTYVEVIASNPAYSAEWYAKWLPVVSFTLLASSLLLLLFFFLLPWFSVGNSLANSLFIYSGLAISSTGALNLFGTTFTFPLLWFIVIGAILNLGIAALLLWNKMLTFTLGVVIRITYGVILLIELVYLFVSFFDAYPSHAVGNVTVAIATSPSTGAWLALLITFIAGCICLALIPELLWSWELAIFDLEHLEKLPPTRIMAKRASR